MDRGSLWFGEINDQLKDTTVGIICLTQENKTRPWILFEAGALAKGLSTSRVCTLLIDLEPRDIEDPLAQFNHTLPTKESIHALVKTLNNALGATGLDMRVLDQVFETYWQQFSDRFEAILEETISTEPTKPRPKEDMLGEILENTRLMSSRIRKLEAEIDRGKDMRLFDSDVSPEIDFKTIYKMVSEGTPPDLIIKRFKGILPIGMIKEMISESAKILSSNEKV